MWHHNKLRACFAFFVAFALLSSCKKTAEDQASAVVTEYDAASIIANYLLPQYGGLILQINNCMSVKKTASAYCGIQKDTALMGSNTSTTSISYTYNLSSRYIYDCNAKSLKLDFSGSTKDEGSTYVSDDRCAGTFTLLAAAPFPYQLAVNQERSGQQRIKGVGSNTFTSTVNLTASRIDVDPVSNKILSGVITLKMTGTGGAIFEYSGTFTFSGGNKGVLVLNTGKTYPISWY